MKSLHALIILAHGFEEVEAIAVIDVLRRAHIEVTIAGLNYQSVTSVHQVTVIADVVLHEVQDRLFDVVILPGGQPGATYLQESPVIAQILSRHVLAEKLVAAICAAPRILNDLGFLEGRRATSFPGTKPAMDRCVYAEEPVVLDGTFLTSRGPGTALAFGLAIVAYFSSQSVAAELAQQLQMG